MLAGLLPYRWSFTAAVFVALVALLGAQQIRLSAAHAEAARLEANVATVQAEWAHDKARAAAAAASAAEAYRAEEQRRAAAQRGIEDAAEKEITAARADAAAAAATASELRRRIAATVAAGRRAACNPAAAEGGKATADPLDLLADVLARADQRAGELAAFADAASLAGRVCEHSYDALSQP